MLTGTPLDLTPFGGPLAALGWLYWLAALAIVAIALWLPKAWWKKLLAAALVSGAVIYPVFIRPVTERVDAARNQQDEFRARLADATALFEQRCKTAGEKIHRTVENVDGVVWMKWRPDNANESDQFRLDDPYGHDCGGTYCIERLLRVTTGIELNPEGAKRHRTGYRFVETTDPKDGKKYRYIGLMKLYPSWTPEGIEEHRRRTGQPVPPDSYRFTSERQPIEAFTARYGITWDDISTREDRERWVAGGSLKVIELKTNEVMAERVGFMIDRGQGSRAGFRSPWSFAVNDACPEFPQISHYDPRRYRDYANTPTRQFAVKALTPTTGD